jgi:RHH-type proline utilization regulon transcriptional repressor/proline dehydrogenase/delta 1-pyrroline-5-carboxylate dehydrogenase
VVRIDDTFSESELTLIDFIQGASGVTLTYSAGKSVDVFGDPTVETVEQLVARAGNVSRVRWLSREVAPTVELLERGVTVDRRPIAQRGDIEMPRWLLEQSVAITHHRYGNVNAGPKPHCPGLGEGLSVLQSQVFLTAVPNLVDHRGMLRRRHRR